jgi:hypothetical protein
LRHEGVAHLEERRDQGPAQIVGRGREQHLEGVGIGAQALAHHLADLPVGAGAVGARQIERRLDQAGGPGQRQDEHAAAILVAVGAGQAPGPRADHDVQDDRRRQRGPGVVASPGVADLPGLARHQLVAPVGGARAVDDRDHQPLTVATDHAPDRARGDDPLADRAIDPGRDLGAERQRHRGGIDVGQAAQAQAHARPAIRRTTCSAGMPVTPPPPWVADDAWYSPRIGVV